MGGDEPDKTAIVLAGPCPLLSHTRRLINPRVVLTQSKVSEGDGQTTTSIVPPSRHTTRSIVPPSRSLPATFSADGTAHSNMNGSWVVSPQLVSSRLS